ncbi:replication initiation and membrane attachment family protein [Bacillus sp. V5-8f]|uniref:replication initiation and membrane attachment family protein n=1 Tax=Bacillus sp. V5-8f TaxID=2053044 RepID=UPI000C770AEE|nr:replication initiation and membrane attachment family protein [Bacillus sp. V5-8f]PLT32319.1 Replication initiation and membrane attachment protein [Bacillus sp. V5-8f]
MTKHWHELLPVDRYSVSSAGLVHEYDRKVITLLYQPLIGPVSVSLYMTLWSELEENRLWSQSSLHYNLMNTMGLKLGDIFQARTKLEGIGLLNVYKKKTDEENQFLYELLPPLSPEQFFTDGMLNIYLYKKVGKVQFGRLKKFFCDAAVQVDEYKPVTKSFTEVFSSDHLDSLYVTDETMEELKPQQNYRFIGRVSAKELEGFQNTFDFELFFSGLQNALVPKKAFTPKVMDTIAKLSFLYGIDVFQMQKLVMGSMDADDQIDEEELRKAARDWYQIEYHSGMPALTDRMQPAIHLTPMDGEPETKEEMYIRQLETVSPRERLIQLSGGGEPSKSDLQIIEGIMLNQNLNPGVVNVLIDYVMIKTDMKLTKAYCEKIASHWARKKVVTVKDAMELAKSEHRQYQSWATGKKQNNTSARKAIRTEIVPDWMKDEQSVRSGENKKNKENKENKENPDETDLDAWKRQMEDRLNNL